MLYVGFLELPPLKNWQPFVTEAVSVCETLTHLNTQAQRLDGGTRVVEGGPNSVAARVGIGASRLHFFKLRSNLFLTTTTSSLRPIGISSFWKGVVYRSAMVEKLDGWDPTMRDNADAARSTESEEDDPRIRLAHAAIEL
ncbi:hypothetical protein PM082_019756 [Marasmius tenuissimus]|nr:hypothetical protein PM082_019756 [Marasmius tenuissimus]